LNKKPTYKELEQFIKELKREATDCRLIEKVIKKNYGGKI